MDNLVRLMFMLETTNAELSKGIEDAVQAMTELQNKNSELEKENQELRGIFDTILGTLNARAMWATDEQVGNSQPPRPKGRGLSLTTADNRPVDNMAPVT